MEAILRHGCPPDRLSGERRLQALLAHVKARVPGAAVEAERAARLLLPELSRYGELIGSDDGHVAGLLVRGEDEHFTRRVQSLMHDWSLPAPALRQHALLARAFDHKRCFLKLEWRSIDGAVQPLVALYYRRRPRLADAIDLVQGTSGLRIPAGRFAELGRLLGKDSVHFVCLTARANAPLHYKMYFSQLQAAGNHEAVRVRIARALQHFAPQPLALARWAAYHDCLSPCHREQTLFISLAINEHGVDPSIKIDYPDVAPAVAVGLLDVAQQEPVACRLRDLCIAAGTQSLSYLGLRLGLGQVPILKGYADYP